MSGKSLSLPGFIDVHVHFRDPGMPNAEDTASGLASAARGGFSAVVTMPNTVPACDTPEMIRYQLERREAMPGDRKPVLIPSACITSGRQGIEVAELERLAEAGAAFFTDDGSYVSDDHVMEQAMRRIAKLGMCVCEHAMDPRILAGGVIRNCPLAQRLGLKVIPPETETTAIRRDLSICRVTGCRLHIQHISTAEGVALVRSARREGLPVTAEATPHHLLFCCEEIESDDGNFKMAPPIGNREDRAELRKAVKDGVLMFATDHAPHLPETKAKGFAGSANGIIGLEAAIPVTYAVMVEEEGMPVADWARAWHEMPLGIIGRQGETDSRIADLPKTEIVIGERRLIPVSKFASRSRNCPYEKVEASCFSVPLKCR